MARKFGQKNEQAQPSFGMGMNPAMNANKMYAHFGANELKQFFKRSNDLYGKPPLNLQEDYRVQVSYVLSPTLLEAVPNSRLLHFTL